MSSVFGKINYANTLLLEIVYSRAGLPTVPEVTGLDLTLNPASLISEILAPGDAISSFSFKPSSVKVLPVPNGADL